MNFELTYTEGKRTGSIRRNFNDQEFEEIKRRTPWVNEESRDSIRERVYCLLNDIRELPKCKICGNDTNFLKSGKYSICCSKDCQYIDKDRMNKAKITKKCRYGSSSFVNLEKRDQTNLKRYGNVCVFNSDEVKDKIKNVLMERYGVESYARSSDFSEKMSIGRAKHFQLRRNEEGTDYAGTVYILKFMDYNAFKIGLTSDFEGRSKALRKDFGDFEIIKLIDTDECFSLESYFHNQLDEFRICLSEGVGRTEFFSEGCISRLEGLISENL